MSVHVPTKSFASHASHWPVHELLQHTSSTQAPLAHSAFPVQGAPFWAVGVHAPASQ